MENLPSNKDSSDKDIEIGHRVRFGKGTVFGEGRSTWSKVANSSMVRNRNRTEPSCGRISDTQCVPGS